MAPLLLAFSVDVDATPGRRWPPTRHELAALEQQGRVLFLRERAAPRLRLPDVTMVVLTLDPIGANDPDTNFAAIAIGVPREIADSAPNRRRSFLGGRAATALALQRMDPVRRPIAAPLMLPIAEHRGPHWPTGIIGSITHTSDVAGAIIARHERYRGLGVDMEPIMTDDQAADVGSIVAPELRANSVDIGAAGDEYATLVTAIFSAKESLYKCIRPLVPEFFDFTDATMVSLDLANDSGRLQLLRDLSPSAPAGSAFDVHFHRENGALSSAIAWPS